MTDVESTTRGDRNGRGAVPRWLARAAAVGWRVLVVGTLAYLALQVIIRLYVVTLPIIVAIILATLCVPAAAWLERRGLPPAAAALAVVVGGMLGFAGIIALLAPAFVDQIVELGPTVRQGYENVLTWLEEGPLSLSRERIEQFASQFQAGGQQGGSSIVRGVAAGAATVGQGVAGLALTIVLLFFFVKDRREILGWLRARTPERQRDTAEAVAARSWDALSGYVRGTAIVALIDAVGIAVGLLILGVPLVAPLAVLVFFGAFLPVIGAFIAGLIAVLVALADGGFTTALLVLGLIVLVQQIEGNVLQPIIMRRTVALHPVVVLTALSAGAALAGIIGAFLGVPIAAVAAAAGNELRLRNEVTAIG